MNEEKRKLEIIFHAARELPEAEKLAAWGLPRGPEGLHENYLSEEQYYGSKRENTRSYPVYHPKKEPAGYWEWLNSLEHEPIVEPGKARTPDEGIRLGRDAYDQLDHPAFRTDDPEAIAFLRDPERFNPEMLDIGPDGTVLELRWVVEAKGRVVISVGDCRGCHLRRMPDGSLLRGAPGNLDDHTFVGPLAEAMDRAFNKWFGLDAMTPGEQYYVAYGVPWLEGDIHAGMYLYSLEPEENPMANQFSPQLVARGRDVFKAEACARRHKPPDYSGNMLLPVIGFDVPEDHPLKDHIRRARIDTDPGAALKTCKGTGLYKVPSLRGVWYRGVFGHDGSVRSLEDWFDPKRLRDDYVPSGWKGPGVEKRAVPGHEYGLDLSAEEREALIAFLKTL